MTLSLLEDLIAVEDAADLAEVGPLLAWLEGRGLLDLRRLAVCGWCRRPFVGPKRRQLYCSAGCQVRGKRWPHAGASARCYGCRRTLPIAAFRRHPDAARHHALCDGCRQAEEARWNEQRRAERAQARRTA